MNEFLPFDKKVKLYVFKDEGECQVSFLVNAYTTMNKRFTIAEMTTITENWASGVSGLETQDSGRIWWEYRDCGPRPHCLPASFVAVSIQGWNFRLTVDEMEQLVYDFNYQLNNKNHWD
jgi:hypothetical protein